MAAACVGQRDAAEPEQELEAQRRPGACKTHRDRPGTCAFASGQGSNAELLDFVVEEQTAVGFVEGAEGVGQRVVLFSLEGQLLGALEGGVVDDSVGVARGDALVAEVSVEAVARRNDRVRPQCMRFEVARATATRNIVSWVMSSIR